MDVVVLSGSRADRGALKAVAEALKTNVLCLPEYAVGTPCEAALAASDATQLVMSMISSREAPDFAVVLGDRHEVLGAATALNLMNVPIAHLSGGDITEGSQDNAMRHAITKLSHLHFPTNEKAADRICSMGEEAWRVHNVGCPGIDRVLSYELYDKNSVCKRFGIQPPYILVAYQPATLHDDPIGEAQVLLDYLNIAGRPCVFTTLNPDPFSGHIQEMFTKFAVRRGGAIMDMPQKLYLSVMKHCEYMIGNSSSGFYEAPTLKVPFVNVGDRQKGRHAPGNIVSCSANVDSIIKAVKYVKLAPLDKVVNPYGDGNAAKRIVDRLDMFSKFARNRLLTKVWVDHGVQSDLGTSPLREGMGSIPGGGLSPLGVQNLWEG